MPSTRTCRRRLPLALAALALVAALGVSERAHAQTTTSVTLVWTAPGDDGTIGRATRYDLRYSTSAIAGTDTTTWWNNASIVNVVSKIPSTAGYLDSMVVSGLVLGVRYYAILRAADEVPNWSAYSNVATFILSDKTPPKQVVDLNAR
jgi:hypothetical protein